MNWKLLLGLALSNIIWGATIDTNPTLNTPSGVTISNWSYARTTSGGICTPSGDSGIDASINGAGALQISGGFAASGGVCDHLIGFDAEAPTGLSFIGLTFNGSATGDAFTQVVETVFDQFGNLLDQAVVDTSGGLQSFLFFEPQSRVRIVKDIMLLGDGGIQNHATVSLITQSFETGGEVPEPGTMAGMGIGLVAVAAYRRKVSRQ